MKIIKIILIWSLVIVALTQGFGQEKDRVFFDNTFEWNSEVITLQQNYSTDTLEAIILVSTNNLPVHTIQGKWIKYRWNTAYLMDWWEKPEDQILDTNFLPLDPTYYVWDYKIKNKEK